MPAKEAQKVKKAPKAGPAQRKKTTVPVHALAVGLKKSSKVTRREVKKSPYIKGRASKRTKLIREVIREVSGNAPYEKRIMELLRNDLEKRALKLAKRKLGVHRRAKKKVHTF